MPGRGRLVTSRRSGRASGTTGLDYGARVLRVCADALLVYVACSKLRAYATQGFVDQCGREPDTLRPIFVVWLTLQVAY